MSRTTFADVVSRVRENKILTLCLLAMAAALALVASPAWATTSTVTSTADTGDATPEGVCNTCGDQDARDRDTGPNNLQNFPVITATTLTGTLRSKPEKNITVQLFSNPPLTNQGKGFLGQVQVKINRRSKAVFSFLGTTVSQADTITATGADGTSEFSDSVAVVPVS